MSYTPTPRNLILDTDSYKASHFLQYPPGTRNVFNYLEARTGGAGGEVVFFGLAPILDALGNGITEKDVTYATKRFAAHGLPFPTEGWMRLAKQNLGLLPLRIKALREGTVAPCGVPLLTCEATMPGFGWVVGWFETMLMRLWYPITVATRSREVKKLIKGYMLDTCDNLDGLPFKLHDFGSRGVSCREQAEIGGAAHLVNFMGTDTFASIEFVREHYLSEMAGFSIPAAEHSTITSWGKENETEAYRNMLRQFAKPGSILAVVSDSYDIYHATEHIWGEALRQHVIDSGATVVVRPDSGDPVFVVNTILHKLAEKFGYKTNSKGYRVINHVRVIQGDGLNPAVIEAILKSCKLAGFSADNVAFGMGAGLLQQVNRDTYRFAYKCSAIEDVNGNWKPVFKQPATDPTKASKAGRVGTHSGKGGVLLTGAADSPESVLETVFENGELFRNNDSFDTIRRLAGV